MTAPYITDASSPAYGRSLSALGIDAQIGHMIRQMPSDTLQAGIDKMAATTGLDDEKMERLAACRAEYALRAAR